MTSFVLAYNTSGFTQHRLEDCLQILAELGYGAVSLTPDVHHLDPFRSSKAEILSIARLLDTLGLRRNLETGARFLLDPRRKHRPTLLCASARGRNQREGFLLRVLEMGAALGAEQVSLWSGSPSPDSDPEDCWRRLLSSLRRLLDRAEELGLRLCFEPEPGMFVADMADFRQLCERLNDERLGLTLDLGHLACTETASVAETVEEWSERLANVHIEDIKDRQHIHLPFGEGDLVFPPIFRALCRVQYRGLVCVELGRDAFRAPSLARQSFHFLSSL